MDMTYHWDKYVIVEPREEFLCQRDIQFSELQKLTESTYRFPWTYKIVELEC